MPIQMDSSVCDDRNNVSEQEWYSRALVQNTEEILYFENLINFATAKNPDTDDIKYMMKTVELLYIKRTSLSEKYMKALQNK